MTLLYLFAAEKLHNFEKPTACFGIVSLNKPFSYEWGLSNLMVCNVSATT